MTPEEETIESIDALADVVRDGQVSLRDRVAMHVLAGLATRSDHAVNPDTCKYLAEISFEYADAFLKAR